MINIPRKLLRPLIVFPLWGILVGVGFWSLWGYETAAGQVHPAATTLPANAVAAPEKQRPTLMMTVHPGCPCSRASMTELARLMTHAKGRLNAYVIFSQPPGFTEDTTKTDLWTTASAIPDVHVLRDTGGIRCKALNATISGQVFLYDASGALQFTGGITASRAHEGENDGIDAIEAYLDTGHPTRPSTPVYGCMLN
jgi:hypothetical protein